MLRAEFVGDLRGALFAALLGSLRCLDQAVRYSAHRRNHCDHRGLSGGGSNDLRGSPNAFGVAYGRAAEPEEMALALRFVQGQAEEKPAGTKPPDQLTAWEQLAQVLLLANEFIFID